MKSSTYWIEKLGLEKHPEGGFFKEVYRSKPIAGIIPYEEFEMRCIY